MTQGAFLSFVVAQIGVGVCEIAVEEREAHEEAAGGVGSRGIGGGGGGSDGGGSPATFGSLRSIRRRSPRTTRCWRRLVDSSLLAPADLLLCLRLAHTRDAAESGGGGNGSGGGAGQFARRVELRSAPPVEVSMELAPFASGRAAAHLPSPPPPPAVPLRRAATGEVDGVAEGCYSSRPTAHLHVSLS